RGDVHRSVLDDHPDHGDCKLARREEIGPGLGGDVPNHGRSVRRIGRRRHPHHRRAHFLSCARARASGRAFLDRERHPLLSELTGPTTMESSTLRNSRPVSALFDPKIVIPAIGSALVKLNPRTMMKNPVMFVLEVVSALTTVILIRDLITGGQGIGFEFQIVLWLWFTVLFA